MTCTEYGQMQHKSDIICEAFGSCCSSFFVLYVPFLLSLKFNSSCDLLQFLKERKSILASEKTSPALYFGSGLKPFDCSCF